MGQPFEQQPQGNSSPGQFQHPHRDEIFPKSAFDQLQVTFDSMNIWRELGERELSFSHQQAAEQLIQGSPKKEQQNFFRSLEFSMSAESTIDGEGILQLAARFPQAAEELLVHMIRGHSDPRYRFRAATILQSAQQEGAVFSEKTSVLARTTLKRFGADFLDLVQHVDQLFSLADSGLFDANPCIGYTVQSFESSKGPAGKAYVVERLQERLFSENPSARLAAAVVLCDVVSQPGVTPQVVRALSDVISSEENSDVRYYLTEGLVNGIRLLPVASFPDLRSRAIASLFDLKSDDDAGVRSLVTSALELG